MEEVGSDVEAHVSPTAPLGNPAPASFAEYILRHGTRILDQQRLDW